MLVTFPIDNSQPHVDPILVRVLDLVVECIRHLFELVLHPTNLRSCTQASARRELHRQLCPARCQPKPILADLNRDCVDVCESALVEDGCRNVRGGRIFPVGLGHSEADDEMPLFECEAQNRDGSSDRRCGGGNGNSEILDRHVAEYRAGPDEAVNPKGTEQSGRPLF